MNCDKQERCDTQPVSPSVKDHVSENRRRTITNANEIEVLIDRINSVEGMLGVSFSQPRDTCDIEDLTFRE